MDVRLNNHLNVNQNLQSSLSLFYQNIRGSQFGLEKLLKPRTIKINLGIYNFIVICWYRSPSGNFAQFLHSLDLML